MSFRGSKSSACFSFSPPQFTPPHLGGTDAQGAEEGHIWDQKSNTHREEYFSSTQRRSQVGSKPPSTETKRSRSVWPGQEGPRDYAGPQDTDFNPES